MMEKADQIETITSYNEAGESASGLQGHFLLGAWDLRTSIGVFA